VEGGVKPRGTEAGRPPQRPNLVHIVADDMGWRDPGHRGGPFRTPRLDALAAESVELTRFYVCPVCSPTRAALLTGRYPHRMGLGGPPMQWYENKGLPPGEYTLPEMLRDAGYRHRAAIGKWHLGNSAACFHPLRRGFTSFYGHYCGAIDYWTHERAGELDWHRGADADRTPGYSTRLLTDEAVRFIETVPAREPFHLYLAYNAVHTPLQAPEETVRSYDGADLGGQNPVYAAMMTEMDAGIGRVLDALAGRGMADDTLVLFHSDNGGVARDGLGSNRPFRGAKGTTYEGGIRVGALARWPRRWRGGRTCDALMGHVDLLPTFAAAAGHALRAPNPLDGLDALPWIDGASPPADRALYPDGDAVVTPRWKLAGAALYDLEADPGETRDVATAHADIRDALHERLGAFRALEGAPYVPPGLGERKDAAPKDWTMPDAAGGDVAGRCGAAGTGPDMGAP